MSESYDNIIYINDKLYYYSNEDDLIEIRTYHIVDMIYYNAQFKKEGK